MALSMRILIAYPSEGGNRIGLPVWDVRDMIDLGNIVRLNGLVMAETTGKFDPFMRAGICAGDMILDRLFFRAQELDPEHFVPHFLIHKVDEEENGVALAFEARAKGCVDCGPRDATLDHLFEVDQGRRYPSREAMEKHNMLMALRPDEMRRLLKERMYSVFTDAPLMWAPCAEVAEWLREDDRLCTAAALEVAKTETSAARFQAWMAHLSALGACDARAIFLFPSLDTAV